MRKLLIGFILGIGITVLGYLTYQRLHMRLPQSVEDTVTKVIEKPLEKYSFERLQKATFTATPIVIGKEIKEEDSYTSRLFSYTIDGEHLNSKDPKKVSGLMNIPNTPGTYPLVVMFRGFVPKEMYEPGIGTQRGGEYFASNGFITLAPDFLGFGQSDSGAKDSLEDRFQTYPTAIQLLSSLETLNTTLEKTTNGTIQADTQQVVFWGHSNGGHIALATLAITGKLYPTVLWNPVTKPFPYSILFFADELDDEGKGLRAVVSRFEEDYDIFHYSPSRYYYQITAPIQLHQGEDDREVPQWWSDDFVETMKERDKDITYFIYSGDDHNLAQGGWARAIERSLTFYEEKLNEIKE